MTTIGADIDTTSETDILEALDFEESPPNCDFTDCESEAKAKLVCGACGVGTPGGGLELMCIEHTVGVALTQQMHPEEPIRFDQTCGHTPELGNCVIVPL